MKFEQENSTPLRDSALRALLTRARSSELMFLQEVSLYPGTYAKVATNVATLPEGRDGVSDEHPSSDEFEGKRRNGVDAASDQEYTALLEHCWAKLSAIDAAVERLRLGQYGLCEDCGNEISLEWLTAVPLASHCVGCQRERENRLATDEPDGHDSD